MKKGYKLSLGDTILCLGPVFDEPYVTTILYLELVDGKLYIHDGLSSCIEAEFVGNGWYCNSRRIVVIPEKKIKILDWIYNMMIKYTVLCPLFRFITKFLIPKQAYEKRNID